MVNIAEAQSILDIEKIRNDFPILSRMVNGHPLIYFDNGATAQKPQQVLDRLNQYYRLENSNIHRSIHELSTLSTVAYENARKKAQKFLNAPKAEETIYVRGTTEAFNLLAYSFAEPLLQADDEILITYMEHHANIVPWQIVCERTGAKLRVVPINEAGEICLDEYRSMITDKTKLVSVTHVSNALGTVNPIKEMTKIAHDAGVPIAVDGAQAVPHMAIDVQDLGCDFYIFSGHKLFGPTGIGILWGKEQYLEKMIPYQSGGEMILRVTFEKTTYNGLPHKFEAGTPNIAGAIGLGTALDYVQSIGLDKIGYYESALLQYATSKMETIDGLRIIGTAENKASVISFVLGDAHPHDTAHELDRCGIAVRAGHHCAQPVMERFGVSATTRASLSFYNTFEEIDRFTEILPQIAERFKL